MKKLPRGGVGFGPTTLGPYEIFWESIQNTASFILLRPILFLFSGTLLVLAYAAINNRRIQNLLLAFPYDRFYTTIKSDKMITFYATVIEVVFEVLTAIILAGVSIVITSWLLLEEAVDRRNQKIALNLKGYGKCPTDFVDKKDFDPGNVTERESQLAQSPRSSQHTYFISPSQSRISGGVRAP